MPPVWGEDTDPENIARKKESIAAEEDSAPASGYAGNTLPRV